MKRCLFITLMTLFVVSSVLAQEQGAVDTERRILEAEKRALEAEKRAFEAEKRAYTAENGAKNDTAQVIDNGTDNSKTTGEVKNSETQTSSRISGRLSVVRVSAGKKHETQTMGGVDNETVPERVPMTGFLLGSSFTPGVTSKGDFHFAVQAGVVHSRPISESIVSLNVEGNILAGEAGYPYHVDEFGFFGINVPLTVLLQLYLFSLEAGVEGDVLFGDGKTLFNVGFVVGAGIGFDRFSKKYSRRYFYRYCGGIGWGGIGTHVVGMRWLF